MTTKYPDNFPLDSVREIVNVVRSGDIKSQASILAFHIWNVQGYAQKTFIGDPDVPVSLLKVQSAPDGKSALDCLEDMLSDEPQAQSMIPWPMILSYLLKLLQDLLDNANAA
jgi:hypothetical protein